MTLIRSAFGATLLSLLALSACGSEDESKTNTTAAKSGEPSLQAIKTYLTDHTEALAADADSLNKGAEEYYKLAESKNFDYEKLMKEDRDKVQSFVKKAQADFRKANPDYEEMEGVVAGTPSLADYDVIIDAGSDGSDPENAVPFSIKTPRGKTYKQPGNLNFLVETTVFGTEDKFQAEGVKADLNGDGKVEFGEAVPNADFYLGTTRTFKRYADELNAAAKKFKPNNSDAFTSLVVMTPTMSEYFEAWKNSRFIAGSNAKETAFVASSRLNDIEDILSGLVLTYENIRPTIDKADKAQAEQTQNELIRLRDFVAKLRKQEADGKKFTAEEADTLGTQAQEQAEEIAGQVTQAAARLNVKVEEG